MLLETFLKEKNITYRNFAKTVNISPQYLCDLIKGRNSYISKELAERIKLKYPEIDILKINIVKYSLK